MIIEYHRLGDMPRSCSLDKFESQVKLAKQLGAKITFDDNLKCQMDALPILKKYDMVATFFICTNFENEVFDVHKIWFLLDYADELINKLNLSKTDIIHKRWLSPYNPVGVQNLKYFLLHNPKKLSSIFNSYFNESETIKDFYLLWHDIKYLYSNGMEIGSHSHTHKDMKLLSKENQEYEIGTSTDVLTENVCKPVGFSYPFGEYNDDTINLLKKYGYKYAVCEGHMDMYKLLRVDTNDWKC